MELHQSMIGYFEYIRDTTYIDKYPSTIITLEELRDRIIVEFGSGTCNDAKLLLEQGIVDHRKLFLVESDTYYLVDGLNKIEGCDECPFFYMGECPDDKPDNKKCGSLPNICPKDVLECWFPDEFADFVYANNFLHCAGYKKIDWEVILLQYLIAKIGRTKEEVLLEVKNIQPKDQIKMIIAEAYRILKSPGVFFGRTLSDYLDRNRLKRLQHKPRRSVREEFVIRTIKELQEGRLVGISPEELGHWAEEAGFQKVHTETNPEDWKPIRDFYFRCEK